MLTTQYLKQQEEYSEKYGEKTLVLMQVGSFMEFYSFEPKLCEKVYPWPNKKIGHVTEVASLLNMLATRKDKKKPYSLENCGMAGFPVVSYEKHRDVLLANGYTIVKIEQKKDGKDVTRFVSEILSPGTNLENISSLPITNNIVSIYIEVLKENFSKEDYILAVGISCIDVTTGENSVLEIYSKEKDAVCAIHEIYRYLNCMRPRELLLTLNYKNNVKEYEDFLVSSLELDKIEVYIYNKLKPEFLKIDYCTQFLSNIFSIENIKNNPNIIEDLALERIHYGCVSYVILLNYCYEHNPSLVEKLSIPNTSWLNVQNYLVLTHNAINQLDLLPSKTSKKHNRSNKNIDSLLSVVNYTKTALGKRYLISRLTHPITDVKILNETYDMIEDLLNKKLLDELRNLLKEVPDLERYQRKLYLKLIKPNEFNILFQGYIKIGHIYRQIYNSGGALYKLLFDSSSFNNCLQNVLSKYKLDVLSKSKLDNGKLETDEKLFHDKKDEKFDKYWEEIIILKDKINLIVETLNSLLENTKGKKIVYSLEDKKDRNLGLWTTAHKATVLLKSDYNKELLGNLKSVNVGKDVMITSDIISETCSNYVNINEELSKYLYSCYNVTISDISKYNFFETLNSFISKVDYICSNSKCALENKYFRPIINGETSCLEIKDLRHPIVECLIQDQYVTNDVSLNKNGILLYGQNSSGKSTFGKAIALNLIMAQAGLYTAGKITYYPYEKIITRLSGHDSVMTGESSFIIEMKELRTILRNSDDKTLVIADEIARGTESVSATSLSISSICYLIQQKSSFIFSTHLHNLADMKDIRKNPSLKICHLSLRYDGKKLIYDRKLKEGAGDSIYGLEVANSLGLDNSFMKKAYEIRNEIEGISTKKSRYNSKVYIDSCFICGNKKDLETHHIKEQMKSDKKGFIENMHKNIPGNLLGICEECHDYLHANGLSIVSEETSKGISLHLE